MQNRIKKVLLKKGLKQTELAEKLGIKPQYINRVIQGRVVPSVALAIKIARTLDVKVEDIFFSLGRKKENKEGNSR